MRPRISLFVFGLNSCSSFPIVSYRDAHSLCAPLSGQCRVISNCFSGFAALSVRAMLFLRALRTLRGSIFSPCSLCLRGKFYTPHTPKLYTLLYFPAKTRTKTTPNPKHFLRYQNSYLFVIISTFFLYPMPHAPCPMPLGTPIALI